jgi:hypothetical protein
MGDSIAFSRNVFLDSKTNTLGTGTNARYLFQPNSFSIAANENMKLVLSTFQMRRVWYDINYTNNTFFYYDPGAEPNPLVFTGIGTFVTITIAPGSYSTFANLATAIAAALVTAGFVAATCVYNAISRKFTIVVNVGAAAGGFFLSFYNDTDAIPTGLTLQGFQSDSGEILGGFITSSNTQLLPLFPNPTPGGAFPTGPNTYISPFVAQLSSLDAVYLRTNIPTNNFSSSGFENGVPNTNSGLNLTQIWAKIALGTNNYDDASPFINFTNTGGENFQIFLQQKQLDTMILQITDGRGRILPEVYPGQANNGQLSFKLSFQYEVLRDFPTGSKIITLKDIQHNPPILKP